MFCGGHLFMDRWKSNCFFLRLCNPLSAWEVEAGSAPSRSAPKHSEMDWFVFLKGNPVRMVRFCDIWYPRPFAKPEMETSKVWVLPCEGNVWMTQTSVLRRCFWRKKKAILPLSTWLQRRQISTRLVQADQFVPFGDVNLCFVNLPGEIRLDTSGTKVKPSKSKLAPVVEAHHASSQLSDYPPICIVFAEGVQVGLKFDISIKFCCLFNTTTPFCCKLPIGPHPTSCSWSLQLSMADLLRIQSTKGRSKSKKLPKAHKSYGSQRQILINQSFTLQSQRLVCWKTDGDVDDGWQSCDSGDDRWWWPQKWRWRWRWRRERVAVCTLNFLKTERSIAVLSTSSFLKTRMPGSCHCLRGWASCAIGAVATAGPRRTRGMDGFWTEMSRQELDKWMWMVDNQLTMKV